MDQLLNRSRNIKRIDNWIEYEDQTTLQHFFYNTSTGESSVFYYNLNSGNHHLFLNLHLDVIGLNVMKYLILKEI